MSARRKSAVNLGATSLPKRPSFNNFNLKNETLRGETKGSKPAANPTSIKEVLTMMVLYICKKTIFFDIKLKVGLYIMSLFIISLIGDFAPFPKSYFSRSDNLFNVYFVKIGWFWTLITSVPFLYFTCSTLNCGDKDKVLKFHLPRIAIATFFWFFWTKLFNVIENNYGRCNNRLHDSKSSCLKAGAFWMGFDLSGHVFILIYSSLVLIEEARPIIGWEYIKEHLRLEEHKRKTPQDNTPSSNPLRNLDTTELATLKVLYEKYTPIIRLLFVAITLLQLLWDVMLVCTMLYYHRMIEKVIAGVIAICTWYFTYQAWYPSNLLEWPEMVGKCSFKYQQKAISSSSSASNLARRASLISAKSTKSTPEMPKFMGNPIYKSPAQRSGLNANELPSQGKFDFQAPPPKFL